ncbi:RluA family pseudouridine synthase [Agitococcus lubricus]|uniref:Pseudouridine synthase n=1 Tax=Agitococcus lubricus TaxID=1077255 RepID=A0A2T5IWN5_9GAMM|nr:RluA family pseudouridine synthase [Agitococcus lubricus]PTQ88249.1 ribosomal large subunit pseudouridine synthase A [Agitococcus lubricus]
MRVAPDCPILFCDDDLLIVGKPAGLLTVQGKGADKQDCLLARLAVDYPEIRVIHRLDQDTSGLLVFARHLSAQQQLNKQFEQRRVHKQYIALVFGHVAEQSGEIDAPLRYDPLHPPRHIVDYEIGQSALTQWQVLARQPKSTRVLLKPVTGRSHQLRVHMQLLGHPILGDTLYASEAAQKLSPRLCLHAESLEFYHPVRQENCRFTWPAPF